MNKLLHIIIFIGLILILGVSFFMKYVYTPENIIRTAVEEKDLYGKKYILCEVAKVTGFDWRIIKDETGKKATGYCNVLGVNTYEELPLKYECDMTNTFIFYIEEKRIRYSEEIREDVVEYVATGWDILYPVKHSELFIFDLFKSNKYVTEDDLRIQ